MKRPNDILMSAVVSRDVCWRLIFLIGKPLTGALQMAIVANR